MISDTQKSFKDFLETYTIRKKQPEKRRQPKLNPMFLLSNFQPQNNSI